MTAVPQARPEPGVAVEMAPGLLRICMPLPGPPSHVNCWLIADNDGWMLVDTGRGDEPTRALWRQVFARALGGRPVTRVLVTHFHPDHVGLAGWACGEWNAPLLMPRTEWQRARLLLLEDPAVLTAMLIGLQRQAGAGAEHLRRVAAEGATYRSVVDPLPLAFQVIEEGQAIRIGGRDWTVRIGAGHSPEMACLHDPRSGILISADHILPRISPHVGMHPSEPEGDPLGVFLRALSRFRDLPADTFVLPSHGEPFRSLHPRIDALLHHHEESLSRLLAGAGQGLTAAEALPMMFGRPFEGRQLSFALSETLAHLSHLVAHKRLLRRPAAGGVWHFELPGAETTAGPA
jgi:glyoxylase-like metal-dependent hydrolase (beta-lactamase superfamily II)